LTIHEARRSSEKGFCAFDEKSRMIFGRATAVTISSSPARKTPALSTPSSA
jgi:hypothetical protein